MILFAGDPHNEFKPIIRAVRDLRPEGVVLLGDYDLSSPLEQALEGIDEMTRVYWIPGNHDGDRDVYYDNLFESALSERNINARVVEVDGLRIAGLGGVFRGQIWHPGDVDGKPVFDSRKSFMKTLGRNKRWRDGLPRRHRVSIWWEDYEWLSRQRADILVTHKAPESFPRYGYRVIDDLARRMRAKVIVHGHHHTDYRQKNSDGIDVIGVGLAGVTDDQGVVISPGAAVTKGMTSRRRIKK